MRLSRLFVFSAFFSDAPSRFTRTLWVAIVFVNLLVAGTVALTLIHGYREAQSNAALRAKNLSRILEESLGNVFEKMDYGLLVARDEYVRLRAQGHDNAAMDRFLARQFEYNPAFAGLRFADATGTIRHSAGLKPPSGNVLADRPYFRRMRDEPRGDLVISEPLINRANGRPTIVVGRRASHPDGSFAGAMYAGIMTAELVRLMSQIDVGPHGSAGLWTRSALVARYARDDMEEQHAGATTPSTTLGELLGSGRKEAAYRTVSGIDGVERTLHFRQLREYPLYLVVGLADADVLAKWRDDAQLLAIMLLLFVASTITFSGLAYVAWRERERATQILHEEEAKFRSLFQYANDGIFLQDDSGFIDCNQRGAQMYGLPRERILGRSSSDFSPERQPDGRLSTEVLAEKVQAALNGAPQSFEWQAIRADGTPLDVEVMLSRLELGNTPHLQAVMRDISERKAAAAEIRQLAFYDPLTQLPNRRLLLDRLQRAMQLGVRDRCHGALMLLDLDKFKALNDTLGHAAGDQLLVEVAARLRRSMRQGDTVARFGGDEYVVVLERLDVDAVVAGQAAQAVAEKIEEKLGQDCVLQIAAADGTVSPHVYRCSASIGIVLFRGEESSVDELLRRADTAMYQSKAMGRGTHCFFSPPDGG